MSNNNNALTTVEICNKAIADPVLSKSYRIADLVLIRDNYAKACSTPEQLILFLKAAKKFGVSIDRGEIHAMPAGGFVERTLPNGNKEKVWVDAVVPVIDYKVYTRKLAAKGIYIKSAVVYKNDTFEFDFATQVPSKHAPPPNGGERGPVIGAWASAKIPGDTVGVFVPWHEAVREKDEYINKQKTGRKIPMAQWATKPAFSIEKAAVRRLAIRLSEEFTEYPDDSTFNPAAATTQEGAIETSFTVNEDESAGDDNNNIEPEPEPKPETGPPELPADAVAVCNDIVNLVNDIITKSELPLPPPATLNLVAKHDDNGQGAWANVNAVATKTASIDAVKDIVKYKTLRKGLRELLATLSPPQD